MKINFLKILIFSLLLIEIYSFPTKRNLQLSSEKEIQNGIYLIHNLDGNLNLKLVNSTLYFSSKESKNNFDKFRFYKKEIKKERENEYDRYNDDNSIDIYCYIEEKNSRQKLYFDEETESVLASDTINPLEDDKFLWEIKIMKYKSDLVYYEIKTKLKNKYISYEESKKELTKAHCESSWNSLAENKKTKIKIIKLYKENNNINQESNLLEKEPVDVVIKYIDLNDTSLNRDDFDQIGKDKQNNELKYSLRSILQNIPWVRKIFIIMPNDNIPYLKEKKEINDKIIYIKDKTLLGFDSSSPPTFQFNLHKLKEYDLSENFILMDDDYFIAQPLSKKDFFYEEKGKIYPYLISTEYSELYEDIIKAQYIRGLSNINDIKYHSEDGFLFRKISTLLFLYKIFDKKTEQNTLIEVGYTHNAIPLKISDIEEIYNYIEDKYQYYDVCLRGKKRSIRTLQPQILFMNYARNKYDRAVKEISWKYYDLSDARQINLDNKLFVINTEDKEYYPLRYQTEEEVLNKLFPKPTIYEKEYDNKREKEKEKEKERGLNLSTKKDDDNNDDINEIFNRIQNINKENEDKNKKEEEGKKIEEKKDEEKEVKKEEKRDEEKRDEEKNKEKEIIPKVEEKKNYDTIITTKKEASNNNNYNNNDLVYNKKFEEIKNDIINQKTEYEKKYNQIISEISILKNTLNKCREENSSLNKKIEDLKSINNEINNKLSLLEKENNNYKQSQIDIISKISNLEKKVEKNNDEESTLKNNFENLSDRNDRIQKNINDLSDENLSLNNKLNEIKNKNENKDEKIKDIIEENEEMKKKIKNYENEIDEWKKKVENLEKQQNENKNKNDKNEEQINKLNYEIFQLKDSLNQLKEKNEEKEKNKFFDENTITNIKYIVILIIFLAIIYFAYIKFCKSDEDDSQNIRPMKLSQQYSGYGGFSNNLM